MAQMPQFSRLFAAGEIAGLRHTFPAVTWPAQTTMLTGKRPHEHGVLANGLFHRQRGEMEMWTAGNEIIERPQVWELLKRESPHVTSAVWFPMLAKRCTADYACMPAPVHNPDGSESLWCYSQPTELYGELFQRLGHFPLMNFWGPLANIASTQWIVDSAAIMFEKFRPNFTFAYLPHLDYAAQRTGPDGPEASAAVSQLDQVLGQFAENTFRILGDSDVTWLATTEYEIVNVDHVLYPNRVLREAGLLRVQKTDAGEQLDVVGSEAWAFVDHQFSHVFVRSPANVVRVVELFRDRPGVANVAAGAQRQILNMDHPRAGEVVVVSQPHSWQAYYWWQEDSQAPAYARAVDIHRKPGYDPVELFWDRQSNSVPLDATLVRGSHGAVSMPGEGVCLASRPGMLGRTVISDQELVAVVLRHARRFAPGV
jgi:predicted AlkP superfamily pyrophosphatase or phosphodiesterase